MGDLLLLEVIHGLLVPTYTLFTKYFKGKGLRHRGLELQKRITFKQRLSTSVGPAQAKHDLVRYTMVRHPTLETQQTWGLVWVTTATQRWSTPKSEVQRSAGYRPIPCLHLILIASSLAPITRLQHRLFKLSSEEWEQPERAKEARCP